MNTCGTKLGWIYVLERVDSHLVLITGFDAMRATMLPTNFKSLITEVKATAIHSLGAAANIELNIH
jgi:hypothetical protein